MNRSFSFWEREEWLKKPDLLIVGGGIVGASLALFYQKNHPDHDVLIVEKGVAPEGASTRNAGFTCIGSLSEHLSDMQKAGEETVLKRIERRWNGLNLLKSMFTAEEMGYIHAGGHEIFTDDELLSECAARLDEMNTLLDERLGIQNVYSHSEYMGYPAIYNHVEGAINSGRMMRTLHKKIQKAGVRTWWNTRIDSIDSGVARMENGVEIEAERVAVTVNGFAGSLIGLPVKPARGYVFITKSMADFGWKGTFNHDRGYVYFRNVDNRLLLGGARNLAVEEETTDHFGINPVIKEYLHRFADDVIKLPTGWEMDMEWSGIMGMTADKEPLIKEITPGVFAAAGLSGMGIAIGMQVARELLELIRQSR